MSELQIGLCFPYTLRVHVRCRVQPHLAEFALHISGLGESRVRVFLSVGGLEKDGDAGELVAGVLREHVPEKVHRAALPLHIGMDLRGGLQEA